MKIQKKLIPKSGCSHSTFIAKKSIKVLQNKIILPMLLGILVIGITQFSFAEEIKKTARISVDVEEFEQPQTKYNPQEITISGKIVDYLRGENVTIIIINPSESEKEINVYASKKGNFQTPLYITEESQIGIHQIILKYQGEEVASTSFEILASQ